MTTHCMIPVLGKRMRITQLDNCGRYPAPGTENASIVLDGFVSVSLSSQVEDGTEITKRNAAGAICVNEKLSDTFKRFNAEIEFCGVNPSALDLVSNATPYLDYAGDVAGFTVAEGEMTKKFALEVWTGLSGQACEEGAEDASGYILLPYLQAGVLGDISITGDSDVTFSLTGAYTKGNNAWGAGPYDVVMDGSAPAPLPTPLDPYDHFLLMDTALTPPPAACDPVPMPTYTTTTTTTTSTTSTTTTLG